MAYFSEREGELPPRNHDLPTPDFIQAVVTFLNGLAERGWLARGWPRRCTDDPHPIIATNAPAFWDEALRTLNFSLREPGQLHAEPQPLRILNLLEFVHEHIAAPINHAFHEHFTHWHLNFNGPEGKAQFTGDVNAMFARFGLAFEMSAEGAITRNPPEEIRESIKVVFQTGDNQLDELLNVARQKYLSPNPQDRREGLERLWDGLERMKTILPGKDKKAQVTALIHAAYIDVETRTRIDNELNELTEIGNRYNIRHFETNKTPIPDDAFVDWLFPRCYSVVHALLDKTGRVRH